MAVQYSNGAMRCNECPVGPSKRCDGPCPGHQPEEPWDTGDVVVTHVPEQFHVDEAPERMTLSLSLLLNCKGIRVTGDLLYIGSPEEIAYEIVGIHPYPLGIRCRRLLPQIYPGQQA